MCVIWNDTVFFAHSGDSRAFLASKKGNNVVTKLTTVDHKPETPKERHRIEMHGGVVDAIQDEDGEDFGPKRVWNRDRTMPGLAMSRSLGDAVAHDLGVIATPEIVMVKLNPQMAQDRFIVLGSDGVFEFLTHQYCISKVEKFYVNKKTPKEAAEKLVEDST